MNKSMWIFKSCHYDWCVATLFVQLCIKHYIKTLMLGMNLLLVISLHGRPHKYSTFRSLLSVWANEDAPWLKEVHIHVTSTARPLLCIASTIDPLSSPYWYKPQATQHQSGDKTRTDTIDTLTIWHVLHYFYSIFGDMYVKTSPSHILYLCYKQ